MGGFSNGARVASDRPRDRVLTEVEIQAIWAAAVEMGYPIGDLVRMLLATGQHLGEVAGMRWADIDLDNRLWTLPAEATRAKRRHEVPLNREAIDVLAQPWLDGSTYVFTTRRGRPVLSFSTPKQRFDEIAGLQEPWQLHDLRRTAATVMKSTLSVAPRTVGAVLNHGMQGVPDRAQTGEGSLERKRKALDDWGRYLTTAINGTSAAP